MNLALETIEELMNYATRKAYAQGKIQLRDGEVLSARHLFCFDAEDVSEIHTKKEGVGRGVWFRLKDGRVFDKAGKVSDFDRSLYKS